MIPLVSDWNDICKYWIRKMSGWRTFARAGSIIINRLVKRIGNATIDHKTIPLFPGLESI